MNTPAPQPPPVIDSARVLWFASTGGGVVFTDRIHLLVDGVKLGEVPNLAICRNYCQPDDILLDFCDAEWNSLGVIACASVEAAKARAEAGYRGISARWVQATASDEEVDGFLRDVYGVDPQSEWWRDACSFCGKDAAEVDGLLASDEARICYDCIREFYRHTLEKDEIR